MCEFTEKVAAAEAAVSAASPTEARLLHETGQAIFVDPRPAEASPLVTGRIPGAVVVPLDDLISGNLPERLGSKESRVVTACEAGPLGAILAHELVKRGYQHVTYLEGGTKGWAAAGYPTER